MRSRVCARAFCACVCARACVLLASVVSNTFRPHGLEPTRLLCSWDFPGKNVGVGCHALLQGVFPAQGSNLCLLSPLHCRQILYHHLGSPLLRLQKAINLQNQELMESLRDPLVPMPSSCPNPVQPQPIHPHCQGTLSPAPRTRQPPPRGHRWVAGAATPPPGPSSL